MRSNQISVTGFDADDLSRINITPEMMDIVLDAIRRVDAADPDLKPDAKLDWDENRIRFGYRTLMGVKVTVNEQSRHLRQGGRPTVADWDAVEAALHLEIEQRGLPSRDNEKGWRTKEDVCRWVAEVLEARGESAAWSTIRQNVKAMLKRMQPVTKTYFR